MFDAIDKYKYGIIATFAVAVGIFVYLQLTSVPDYFDIVAFDDTSEVRFVKEEEELMITPENLEIPQPQYEAGKVTNTARDMNDTRQRSDDNWSATKDLGKVEQSVKDYEKQIYEETGGEAKRKAIREASEREKQAQKDNVKDKSSSPDKGSSGNSSPNVAKGNVMVDWVLSNRSPLQNNSWNVRNPGYTCGHGSSGKVAVTIKVGQDGKVITATYDPAGSTSASQCMVEQALKYAKLSRFDYSGSAPDAQSGKIYYTFVSQ